MTTKFLLHKDIEEIVHHTNRTTCPDPSGFGFAPHAENNRNHPLSKPKDPRLLLTMFNGTRTEN